MSQPPLWPDLASSYCPPRPHALPRCAPVPSSLPVPTPSPVIVRLSPYSVADTGSLVAPVDPSSAHSSLPATMTFVHYTREKLQLFDISQLPSLFLIKPCAPYIFFFSRIVPPNLALGLSVSPDGAVFPSPAAACLIHVRSQCRSLCFCAKLNWSLKFPLSPQQSSFFRTFDRNLRDELSFRTLRDPG